MRFELLLSFASLIAVASCSPGPNVLAVITNALRHGRRGAALAIAGNLCALFLIAGTAALGVGGLLKAFPDAYTVMKLAGAAYLLWVGAKLLRASTGEIPSLPDDFGQTGGGTSSRSILLQASLVSLSNPKSIIFLSAAFPAFLDPDAAIAPQFAAMFATIIVVVGCVHASYAMLALRMRAKLIGARGRRWTARLAGLSFAGLGVGLFADALRR